MQDPLDLFELRALPGKRLTKLRVSERVNLLLLLSLHLSVLLSSQNKHPAALFLPYLFQEIGAGKRHVVLTPRLAAVIGALRGLSPPLESGCLRAGVNILS